MTMPNTVRLHRVLVAKPEKVYRAFIEADALAKWLPPNGFACTVHQLDAKVGGAHRMSFRPTAWLTGENRDGDRFVMDCIDQRANSIAYSRIPYATEQGIFAAITGNFFGITGNLIERAGKARKMHSPLLLSPAIGQCAGELCEGEIGRRAAVEQCRHDPG